MATTYTDPVVNLGDGDDDAVGDRNAQEQTIYGNGGQDILRFQLDQTFGSLYGGPGNDELFGGLRSDILDGGDGNDIMYGGASYYESDPIDDFYGGPGNDVGLGYYGSDRFFGEGDSDCFFGGQGNDAIYGGDGDDNDQGTLPVGTPGGFVNFVGLHGGEGNDYINGQDGNDDLFGEAGNDSLYGESGRDVLNGGTGADRMTGGSDPDLYYVDNAGDQVIETDSGKDDAILSFISFTFPDRIENGGLDNAAGSDDVTGNGLANNIAGNDSRNILKGLGGDDLIAGDSGNDTLVGGLGRDRLFGESGRDVFDFDATKESKKGASRDRIEDFKRGQDHINLKDIDAESGSGNQKFDWIGKSDFHDDKGELHYEDKGATVIVQGDTNGDGKADFEIFVSVGSLGKSDFVL